MLQGPHKTIMQSRALRKDLSWPEFVLWRELQKRPGGLKFRKQHPGGPYTLDFFCHKARLVIEVDGEAHERGDRPQRDERKDAWLTERKFRVLRIPAAEVLGNLEGVVAHVVAMAKVH